MPLQAAAARVAGFPGEEFVFEVAGDPDRPDAAIAWLGGGNPATGAGRRFATTFAVGGRFDVVARDGAATVAFPVTVCEVDAWLHDAAMFFGPSVQLSWVRVRSSRFVIGPGGTGWTCNDVVRFKRPARPEDLPEESTLIHELTHVWEHQGGQAQLLRGLIEQIGKVIGRDPYDFGGPAGVRRRSALTDFTKESQAQIVMELWRSEHGATSDTRGVPFATPGYRDDLRRLVRDAGIGTAAPRNRSVVGVVDGVAARLVNGILDLVE